MVWLVKTNFTTTLADSDGDTEKVCIPHASHSEFVLHNNPLSFWFIVTLCSSGFVQASNLVYWISSIQISTPFSHSMKNPLQGCSLILKENFLTSGVWLVWIVLSLLHAYSSKIALSNPALTISSQWWNMGPYSLAGESTSFAVRWLLVVSNEGLLHPLPSHQNREMPRMGTKYNLEKSLY